MNRVLFAFPILAIGAPVMASAQVTAPPPVVQTPAVATGKGGFDKAKIVCRTMDATGSRLQKRKECHTLAEWDEIRMRDRQTVERTQANRYNGNSGG